MPPAGRGARARRSTVPANTPGAGRDLPERRGATRNRRAPQKLAAIGDGKRSRPQHSPRGATAAWLE